MRPSDITRQQIGIVEGSAVGGLTGRVEVILSSDILLIPDTDADGVTVSGQILVKPDIDTGKWYFTPRSAELESEDVGPEGSTVFRNRLVFSIPSNRSAVIAEILKLRGKKFLLAVNELDGTRRIVGTVRRPARLKGRATTGRTRTDRKEVVFTVEAFDSKPAIIFTSTFRTTTPPNVPVAFLAAQDASNIVLSWVDSSDNETGFEVWRSTDNVLFSLLATTAENATTYADTVAVNTVYWYKIRAVNEVYQSPYTLVRTGAILSAPTSLLAAKGTTDGTITVAWTNNHGSAATAVELYRKIGAGSFTLLATLGASAESYEDTYVITDSISREYRVRATRGSFVSPDSTPDSVSIPAQVTGLTLTHQGAGAVLVSWTDVGAIETGYEIEYSPNGTTGWTNVGSTPANDTSELLALAENATSHIRVRATGDSPGAWSDVASIAIPAAPSLLTSDYLGLGEILLSWQDNATNETGQRLEYSTNGTIWSTLIVLAADVETYIHTGRAVNASHFYRLRAETTTANSAYSNTAQVAIPATPTGLVVAQPTAINATTPQPNMLRLTWTDAATNETNYQVYRHTASMSDPEAQGTLLATLPAGTTAYNDLTTADGTTYFYAVRAITATAESAFVQASGKSLDAISFTANPTVSQPNIRSTVFCNTVVFVEYEANVYGVVSTSPVPYTYNSYGLKTVKYFTSSLNNISQFHFAGCFVFNLNEFSTLNLTTLHINRADQVSGFGNAVINGNTNTLPSTLQNIVLRSGAFTCVLDELPALLKSNPKSGNLAFDLSTSLSLTGSLNSLTFSASNLLMTLSGPGGVTGSLNFVGTFQGLLIGGNKLTDYVSIGFAPTLFGFNVSTQAGFGWDATEVGQFLIHADAGIVTAGGIRSISVAGAHAAPDLSNPAVVNAINSLRAKGCTVTTN